MAIGRIFMKGRKREQFKSVLLVCLVFSSLLLSYLIITYKPDYELFTRRTQQKVQEGDKNNLVGFLIPDVMVKTYPGMREEAIVPNSITKISSVEAVKDKKTLKELLVELSKGESTEVRVRNRNIEDITTNNTSEKISIIYQEVLDSSLVKTLFFSKENSNVSLEFDTIVLLKDRPNMLYLYKKDDKNYLQVTLKEAVYDKINEKFNETKKDYAKYSLNNKFIYLKEADEEKVIDEYSAEEVNITRLAKDVFEKKDDVRVGADNEITDGYAILKSQNHRIVYTNPSNEGGKEVGTTVAINNTINFLELGYASDTNYQLTTSLDGITIFQETHKESIVFSKEGHADIVSEDNSNGIYRLTSPKKLTKTYLSSKEVSLFEVEKTEYVINYLYNNTNLKNVTDIVLGYEKTYNKENNSFSYTPAWYVKYNNRYMSFKKIKELVDGGGKL
jgi:yycH protein